MQIFDLFREREIKKCLFVLVQKTVICQQQKVSREESLSAMLELLQGFGLQDLLVEAVEVHLHLQFLDHDGLLKYLCDRPGIGQCSRSWFGSLTMYQKGGQSSKGLSCNKGWHILLVWAEEATLRQNGLIFELKYTNYRLFSESRIFYYQRERNGEFPNDLENIN